MLVRAVGGVRSVRERALDTGCGDYRVIELLEVVTFEVGAVVDLAEEPDEAKRCWIAFDDVYTYINVGLSCAYPPM